MAFIVCMLHSAIDHIGDGLEPAVWMVGETAAVFATPLFVTMGREFIQQQKRVEPV